MKYSILATEGPHDQAFLAKLLRTLGLERIQDDRESLDAFWQGFLPVYPPKQIYTRINVPTIMVSQTHSVAVYWGEGSNLIPRLIGLTTNFKHYKDSIDAFGFIVDADNRQPGKVAKEKAEKLQAIFPMVSAEPGTITSGTPRTGIYILPDNNRQGTLDSCLLECASVVYPDHRNGAERFLDGLGSQHTNHLRTFTREKAVVACVVGVLKPGKTNTASIADNNWISEQTITDVTEVSALRNFIKSLLEIA